MLSQRPGLLGQRLHNFDNLSNKRQKNRSSWSGSPDNAVVRFFVVLLVRYIVNYSLFRSLWLDMTPYRSSSHPPHYTRLNTHTLQHFQTHYAMYDPSSQVKAASSPLSRTHCRKRNEQGKISASLQIIQTQQPPSLPHRSGKKATKGQDKGCWTPRTRLRR